MDNDMLRPAALPIRPWDYVRRRRLLAGLTIAQAAAPFWHREEHRAGTEANMRMFEREGVRMQPYVAREIPRAFPFDPEVYRQLGDLDVFHPRLCRCCCSSDWEPRETNDGASARLDDEQVCTACREDQVTRAIKVAA